MVVTLEVPALCGWIDHRYTVGPATRHVPDDMKGMDPHESVRHTLTGDLVPFYNIPNPTSRDVDFRTDRHGFRNPRDRDQVSVIVVGDSFVLNGTVPEAQTFPRRLESQWQRPVANLGHSGWGPADELDALQRIGVSLKPKAAVWMFYEGNDLGDILLRPAQHGRWYDSLFLTNLYVRGGLLLPRLVRPYTNYWMASGETSGSCLLRCSDPPCERMYMANFADSLTAAEEFALERSYDVLTRAQGVAAENGIELWLAFAPVKMRVYHGACEFEPDSPAARSRINDLPERMATWAAGRNLPFVDLTPPLHRAAASGEAVYYHDDTHWSELGNTVVADTLRDRMRSSIEQN